MSRLTKSFPDYGAGSSWPLPLLYAGITQQPQFARFGNQVQDAENFDFSVFDGASKRAGTELARVINNDTAGTALQTAGNYRMHAIRRDDAEQYSVIYGRGASNMLVRVFEEAGPEATVTISPAAQTYLNSGTSTADDIKMFTVADGTIIVNGKVATGLKTSPNYSLTRTYKNADVMVASGPANDTYHRALEDGTDIDAGYYQYDIGTKTFATYTNAPATFSGWPKLRGDWDDSGSDPKRLRVGFRRQALSNTGVTAANVSGDTWTLNKSGAFTAYTFEAGDQIRITSGAGVTFGGGMSNGWATIISKDNNNQITVRDAATGPAYDTGTSVALAATADVAFDGIGREYSIERTLTSLIDSGDIVDMDDIAAELTQGFRDAGESDATIGWIPNSSGYGSFRITAPWQGPDSRIYIQAPLTGAGGANDLTLSGEDRPFDSSIATVDGGDSDPSPDGLTVRLPITSRWTRKPAPNQPEWQPDETKMPLLLTRMSYAGNGTTPATFTLDVIAWDERLSGDEETNPALSLLKEAHRIGDVAVHQERLWLLGGPYAAGSATGDFFRFYKDDDTILADDDPIERQVGGQSVATIRAGLPMRENLVVNTNAGSLFELSANGGAWTPQSVTVTPTVGYETLDLRFARMDDRLYFASRQHSPSASRIAAQIHEYDYDDGRAQNAAETITDHCPLFFDDNIKTLLAVPAQSRLLVLTKSRVNPADPSGARIDQDTLYIWRTYYSTNNVRQQSAWTKWVFQDRVVDMCLLLSGVQVLFETGNGVWTIERIRFEPDVTDNSIFSTGQYPRRLDRAMGLVGTFDAGNNWTTWTFTTLGGAFNDDEIDTVVKADGTELAITRPTSGTIRSTGNHAATACRVGIKYNAFFTLSEQFVRSQGGGQLPRDGFIVNRGTFPYRRAGAFDVQIARPWATYTKSFAPATATAEKGTFTVFGIGPSDSVTVKVFSNNSRPVNIPMVQLDGEPKENVGR
jgi:hypothetical protein